MAKLTMTLTYMSDPATIKEWFNEAMGEGDEFVLAHRVGLLRHWQLMYNIADDVLSHAQYAWILTHFGSFIKVARFETSHVGLIGLRQGDFTMTMKP